MCWSRVFQRLYQAQQRERVRAEMAESMKALDGSLTASVVLLVGFTGDEIANLGGVGDWAAPR